MRVDGNQTAQLLSESEQTGNPSLAGGALRASASSAPGEDQAKFSGIHLQVRALAEQVLQFPEIRQEKVNALQQVVLGGNYQPNSKQVADAVLAHMQKASAA
jgi:flagellar biosynthesis anti-sigma factor FlgM